MEDELTAAEEILEGAVDDRDLSVTERLAREVNDPTGGEIETDVLVSAAVYVRQATPSPQRRAPPSELVSRELRRRRTRPEVDARRDRRHPRLPT